MPARRPRPADLEPILERIWEGKSLRATCIEFGLHTPQTHTWLKSDQARWDLYQAAVDGRVEGFTEEIITITRAAALGHKFNGQKIDAAGARVFVDAIKWAAGRMAPKSAPVQHHHHTLETLSDAELDERLAALTAHTALPAAVHGEDGDGSDVESGAED